VRRRRGSGVPKTWAELLARFAHVLGGTGPEFAREAELWVRQATFACWGSASIRELNRQQRALAFQRSAGVVLALEDVPDPAFMPGLRGLVRGVVARYFGVDVDGPPWRVDPRENDRPSYPDYVAAERGDFADAVTP
jgi:hypothetical protein